MSGLVSSAEPHALIRYADRSERINAHLNGEARHLAHALQHFAATCTEFRVGVDPLLAESLRYHAHEEGEFDVWVRRVANDFASADGRGVSWTPGTGFIVSSSVVGAGSKVVDGAANWLYAAARWKHWDQVQELLQNGVIGTAEAFVENRGISRQLFQRTGRGANWISGSRGHVTMMDDAYRYLAKGIPYRGTTDRILKTGYVGHGLNVIQEGFENWEDYGDQGVRKVVVGTVVDAAFDIGISEGFKWGGRAAGFAIGGPVGALIVGEISGVVGGMAADYLEERFEHDEWLTDNIDRGLGAAAGRLASLF